MIKRWEVILQWFHSSDNKILNLMYWNKNNDD